MQGSVLTSQLASIIYGSIYAFFILIITIIATIDLLHELNDEKTKQQQHDAIELNVMQSSNRSNYTYENLDEKQKHDQYDIDDNDDDVDDDHKELSDCKGTKLFSYYIPDDDDIDDNDDDIDDNDDDV
eukprot:15105_1